MTLSTGCCPKWPIWWGELGQRTEDRQIIHKHNGHQYWKDDRWDCSTEARIQFLFFFLPCRTPYRFSQSHLSAIRLMRRSQAPPKKVSQGRLLQWRKWQNESSTGNNDYDMNNDTINMLGGHWQGNSKYSSCHRPTCGHKDILWEVELGHKSISSFIQRRFWIKVYHDLNLVRDTWLEFTEKPYLISLLKEQQQRKMKQKLSVNRMLQNYVKDSDSREIRGSTWDWHKWNVLTVEILIIHLKSESKPFSVDHEYIPAQCLDAQF